MATIDRRGATVSAADPAVATDPNPDLAIKAPVAAATTGSNITLSGAQTIDGVSVGSASERVLVKDQTDATTNGIYVAQSGLWQRAADAANNSQWTTGTQVLVTGGTANAGDTWQLTTTAPIVLGTSALTFAVLSSGGGTSSLVYDVVRTYGAFKDGTNAAATTAAIQAAIDAAHAVRGGIVWIPVGTYAISSTLNVTGNVVIRGEARYATLLTCGSNDITVVSVTGGDAEISNIQIEGKGFDTVSFGASFPAMTVPGNNNKFRQVTLYGGTFPLDITGSNNYFEEVGCTQGYGAATCRNGGGNYFHRCDFDNQGSGITSPSTMPYAAWAGTTVISLHETRLITNSGKVYACVATVGGTTGGSTPTMKNFLQTFTDGTVTWSLQAPQTLYGLQVTGSGVNENHLDLCDFTGVGYSASIAFTAPSGGPAVLDVFNSDISYGVTVAATSNAGAWINIAGNELGGGNGIGSGQALNVATGYSGGFTCIDNDINSPPGNMVVGAGVSNFVIALNLMNGSSITVNAGVSDNYTIAFNENGTVSDSGVGTHKTVENAGIMNLAALGATAISSTTATIPTVYGGSAAGSTLNLQSTSNGSPSGDKVTLTAGGIVRGLVASSGSIGFGKETNPQLGANSTPAYVFSNNTATGVSVSSYGSGLFYIGADGGGSVPGFNTINIANACINAFNRLDGTLASPSNLGSGEVIGNLAFGGWGNSAFRGATVRLSVQTSEAWTSTFGSFFEFDTTAAGAGARAQAMRAMGGVIVGTGTTDPGAGNLQASGKLTPGSFTVGTLPAGTNAGDSVYASNCRVFNGAGTQEGAGSGTGGLVNYNGAAWKIAGTNVTAVA